MARVTRILLTLVPLVFALLAFVFTLVAITSTDWAIRAQYSDQTNLYSQKDPIYTLSRSPFKICTYHPVIPPSPSASAAPNSNDDQPPPPNVQLNYTRTCQSFRPFGLGKTSCELAVVTQNSSLEQTGDRRQCQQIHYAGNYAITSSLFISLAFLLTVVLFGLDVTGHASTTATTNTTTTTSAHNPDNHDPGTTSSHPIKPQTTTPKPPSSISALPYLTLTTLTMAGIGIISALISQYCGVLGLVQSAPNNADFASSAGNSEHHDPWIQGRALSIFMTLSWSFALAAAVFSKLIWPTASWRDWELGD